MTLHEPTDPLAPAAMAAKATGFLARLTATRVARTVICAVSAFLLITMGGAILAAPILVPLLFTITRARRPKGEVRLATAIGAAVLAALMIAELTWALTYVIAGEAKPWIWLVPLIAALGMLVASLRQGPDHAA